MLELLGEAAGRTLLLAAAAQCGLHLLRVRAARSRLAVWRLVLAASLAMPLLMRLTPLRVPVDTALPVLVIDAALDRGRPLVAPDDPAPEPPSLRPWLLLGYLVVAAVLAARVLLGVVLSARVLARSVPVRAAWAAGGRVRISREVAAPVTIGRVVLLPVDAVGWPEATRRAVLAHEGAHAAGRDFALLVLSQLNRAAFWFSPLPWWLHRRLVVLTELASDDHALGVTHDRVGYAEVLLEMGRRSGAVWRGPAMARPATLALRIDRVLRGADDPGPGDWTAGAALAGGVVGLSVAVASLAPDPAAPGALPPVAQPAEASGPAPGAAGPWSEAAEAPGRPVAAAQRVPAPGRPGLPRSAARTVAPPRPWRRGDPQPVRAPHPPSDAAQDPAGPAEARPALPAPRTVQAAAAGRLDVDAVMNSTCTGTVSVGLGARPTQVQHPDVVPGQVVAARARFFRRGGAPWVRFDAYGQPPLDVPVRFSGGRVTWVGEYGIAYAVQPWGSDRLIGLAAPVAADSARLDFRCAPAAGGAL